MNKVYIGIDPSFTNTGIVVLDGDKVYSHEYKTQKVRRDCAGETWRLNQAVGASVRWICSAIPMDDIDMFGIEVPMGNHLGGASKVDRLFGYWWGWLDATDSFNSRDGQSYTPSQIKKFFTGHGNADKELMVWFANNVWDFPCTSHDIADAFAIAMLTKYIDEGKYEL